MEDLVPVPGSPEDDVFRSLYRNAGGRQAWKSGNAELIEEQARWRALLRRFEEASAVLLPQATALREMSSDMRAGRLEDLPEKPPLLLPPPEMMQSIFY